MCLTWTRPCVRCDEVFTERSIECTERQKGAPHPMDASSAHTVERILLEPILSCQSFACRRKDRLEARSTFADVQRRKAFNKQYQDKFKHGKVGHVEPYQPDDLEWAEEDSADDRWGSCLLRGHEILRWKPIEHVPRYVGIPDNAIECLRRVYNAPLCDMSSVTEVESLVSDVMAARPDLVVTRRPPSYAQPPISGNEYPASEISPTQSEAGATNGGSVSDTSPSSEGGTWINSVNSFINSFDAQHAIGRSQEAKRRSAVAAYQRGLAHSARISAKQNDASTPTHSPRSSLPNVATPKHSQQLSLAKARTPDSASSDKTVTPATFSQQRHKQSGPEEVTTPARRARIQVAMPDISRLPPMTGSMSRKRGTKVAAAKTYAEVLGGAGDDVTTVAAWPPGKTFSSDESGMPAIAAAFNSLKEESSKASARSQQKSSDTREPPPAIRGRSSTARGTASLRRGKSSTRRGKSSSRKAKSSTPRDTASTCDGSASAISEQPPLTGKTSSSESSDSSGGVPLPSEHVYGLDGSFDDPVPSPQGHDGLTLHGELLSYGQDQFMGQHGRSFPARDREQAAAAPPTDPGPHHGPSMDELGALQFSRDLETLQMGQLHTPSQLLTSQQEEAIAHRLNYDGVVAIKHAIRPAWQRRALAEGSTVNVERLINDHLPENVSNWVPISDLSQVRPPHEAYKDPPPYPDIDPLNYDFVGHDDDFFPQWMHNEAGNPPPPEYMRPTYPTMPSAGMHTQYPASAHTATPTSHPHGRSMGQTPTASPFTSVPSLNHPDVRASFRSPSPTRRFDFSPRAATFSPRGRGGG